MQAELDREREARSQADARMHAASVGGGPGRSHAQHEQAIKHLEIERDALATHNAKLEVTVR